MMTQIIWQGFKFGMLLQLAIGPMCLLVFNTAVKEGFWTALSLVSAIALIDALYIFLSGLGVSSVLKRPNIQKVLKYFGAAVLITFGANLSLSVLGISLLPQLGPLAAVTGQTIFVQGLILTASNPLTIIFWSGVFSTQAIEHNYNRQQLAWFGSGCVLATLTFMSVVALGGLVVSSFLNDFMLKLLNISVGILVAFFGVKLALRKIKN